MTPKRLVVLLFCLALIALTGCGGSKEETDTSLPDELDISTTTTVVDPYAVPKVIDEAYINKVLAAHQEIRAVARRNVINNHEFSPEDQKRIKSMYTGEALEFQFGLFTDEALKDHPRFKPNPGPAIELVKVIHSANRNCIWVTTSVDESQNVVDSPGTVDADVVLIPFVDVAELREINPTHWKESQATAPGLLTQETACR